VNESDIVFRDAAEAVDFGGSFVSSEAFKTLFREGMALVESTAAYLDGAGREESRLLARQAALAYASESMRLTTRLMQIASWLLVQRAVAEGEITPGEALQEKTRVRLQRQEPVSPRVVAELPLPLQDLIGQSLRLHARILHLDALVCEASARPEPRVSPVTAQQDLLRSAFGR
jgi:regulator of CtrA degradation